MSHYRATANEVLGGWARAPPRWRGNSWKRWVSLCRTQQAANSLTMGILQPGDAEPLDRRRVPRLLLKADV